VLRRCSWPASLAILTAIVLGGCHDEGSEPSDRPSDATSAPPGLRVEEVAIARDRFIAFCEELETRPTEAQDLAALREHTATLTQAFRSTPDEEFRRSPRAPEITMRELLRAMALVASKQCGGDGDAIADRLQRVARRKTPAG
jgi:hypothetical protein